MKNKVLSAVAVKYPSNVPVPFITAKGKGELAEKIIKIAEENNIPVKKDEVLVNLLQTQEIGDAIPENTWRAMAEILSFILQNQKK